MGKRSTCLKHEGTRKFNFLCIFYLLVHLTWWVGVNATYPGYMAASDTHRNINLVGASACVRTRSCGGRTDAFGLTEALARVFLSRLRATKQHRADQSTKESKR